jgi:ferric iron reductase protein FhuF
MTAELTSFSHSRADGGEPRLHPCGAVPFAALQPLWLGPLATWLPPVIEEGAGPAGTLDSDAELASRLLVFAERQHPDLPRVVSLAELAPLQVESLASEWSRSLFYRLVVPVLSVLLLTGRLLSYRLHWTPDQSVAGLLLPHGGLPQSVLWASALSADVSVSSTDASVDALAEQEQSLTAASLSWWLEQELLPRVLQLERVAGCRGRILWCTLATYWRWWLQSAELAECLATLPSDQAPLAKFRYAVAVDFIEQASLPMSALYSPTRLRQLGRNPLYQPLRLRTSDGQPVWVRRVCCQRYQLPGLALCSYCPLVQAPALRRRGVSS